MVLACRHLDHRLSDRSVSERTDGVSRRTVFTGAISVRDVTRLGLGGGLKPPK